MQHEDRLGVDPGSDLHRTLGGEITRGDLHRIAVGQPQLLGRGGVHPQVVAGQQFVQQGVVHGVGVVVHGGPAEEQAELAVLKLGRGHVGGQAVQPHVGQHLADDLHLARGGLELETVVAVPHDGLVGQREHALGLELGQVDAGAFHLVGPDILHALEGEKLALAHPVQDFLDDPPQGAAVHAGGDGLVAHGEPGLGAVFLPDEGGPLEEGGLGQDNVRIPAGLAVVDIDGDQQLELAEGPDLGLRVGQGGEGVVAIDKVGPHLIGVARLQGGIEQVQQARTWIPVLVLPADAVNPLGLGLGQLGAQAVQGFGSGFLGVLGHDQPARGLDGPQQGVQDEGGAAGVEGLVVAGHHPAGVEDDLGRVLGQLAHEGQYLRGRYAGLLGGPLGGVGLDELPELLQAIHPLAHEGLVVDFLLEHLVDEGQVEGVFGVGPDLEKTGGLGGGEGGARVDIGAVRALAQGLDELLGLLDLQGLYHVAAIEDEVAGVLDVQGRALAPPAKEGAGGVVGVAAAGAVMIEVVGRTQGLQEGLGQVVEGAAAVGEDHALAAVLGYDILKLLGYVVQGLVPGGRAPLAAAPGAAADERLLGALVVMLERDAGRSLGAQAGAHGLVVGVALHPGDAAINHLHLYGAADGAHAAHAGHHPPAGTLHSGNIGRFVALHRLTPFSGCLS